MYCQLVRFRSFVGEDVADTDVIVCDAEYLPSLMAERPHLVGWLHAELPHPAGGPPLTMFHALPNPALAVGLATGAGQVDHR